MEELGNLTVLVGPHVAEKGPKMSQKELEDMISREAFKGETLILINSHHYCVFHNFSAYGENGTTIESNVP